MSDHNATINQIALTLAMELRRSGGIPLATGVSDVLETARPCGCFSCPTRG